MNAKRITNREQIASFLLADPVVHAFPLGYLDEKYADACEWYGARDGDGALAGLGLLYRGLTRPGLFTAGSAEWVRPVLRAMEPQLPRAVVAHFSPEHRASVESLMVATEPMRRMKRMGLRRSDFVAPGANGARVDVLSHRDTGAILRLYAHWPDNFFEPYQLESGLYFGVRVGDDLACIAGVHNVSETFDVAAIGNLVTHPDHRGQGYASACTARLLRAVFERVGLVTLDVEEANVPAMRTYQRFGFAHHGDFYEVGMRQR